VVDDAGRRSRSKSGTEDPGRRAGSKGPDEERKGIEAETAGLEGTRVVVDLSPASVNAVKRRPALQHHLLRLAIARLRSGWRFAGGGPLVRLPARRDERRPCLIRQPSPVRKSCVPGAPVAARPATACGRRTQRLEAFAQSGLPRARNLPDEVCGGALSEPEGSQGVSARRPSRAVPMAAATARRPQPIFSFLSG